MCLLFTVCKVNTLKYYTVIVTSGHLMSKVMVPNERAYTSSEIFALEHAFV